MQPRRRLRARAPLRRQARVLRADFGFPRRLRILRKTRAPARPGILLDSLSRRQASAAALRRSLGGHRERLALSSARLSPPGGPLQRGMRRSRPQSSERRLHAQLERREDHEKARRGRRDAGHPPDRPRDHRQTQHPAPPRRLLLLRGLGSPQNRSLTRARRLFSENRGTRTDFPVSNGFPFPD